MFGRILRAIESNAYLFHAVNALVAAVWCWYAWRGYVHFQRMRAAPSGVPGAELSAVCGLLMVANSGLLVVFYLLRRRSSDVAGDAASFFFGHLGTWLPQLPLAWPDPAAHPISPDYVVPGLVVMVVGLAASTLGFVSLGRSWGILPANRGVRTGGLYRFVRHPIYATYIIFYANYALVSISAATVIVAVGMPIVLLARAVLEERVLMRDPEYVTYAQSTRYRFFPFLV
jgi:protein-S-isoprenylcysteine O-methyltransferase Ste14